MKTKSDLPICQDARTEEIVLNFSLSGDIAAIINRAKFGINWFRGYRVMISPKSYDLHSLAGAGRSYSGVSSDYNNLAS